MAATDMSKAGLEAGCKVDLIDPDAAANVRTESWSRMLRNMREIGPFTVTEVVDSEGLVELTNGISMATVNRGDVVRDCDDAQTARMARFQTLYELFGGEAGVPESTDTIERYVIPQKNEHPTGEGDYAYVWGDDFQTVAEQAGSDMLDGWMPADCFDLDTGQKIELHYASPVITPAEEQGVTINELDPAEVAEWKYRYEEQYDHVADTITVSITVEPEHSDALMLRLENLQEHAGIEHMQVNREAVRQLRPATMTKED